MSRLIFKLLAIGAVTCAQAVVSGGVYAEGEELRSRGTAKTETVAKQDDGQIVARVNGENVTRLEVDCVLREAFRDREIAEEARPHAEAAALDQVINRRLILAWLEQKELVPSAEDMDKALADFQASLDFQRIEMAEYLAREQHTAETLRRSIAWDIAWGRFSRLEITAEAREKHFAANRPHFDGTTIRVSHLLLGDVSPDVAARVAQAAGLRKQIQSGELTFAAAVEEHSTGTKENGGSLGFIERRGAMPEPFAAAAFALAPGDVSQPIVTPFGVHLIRAEEVKPGDKELKNVIDEVDRAMKADLLKRTVALVRREATLEFTGTVAHFDPETRALVPAK